MLDKLKKANLDQGMYCDMDVMGNESTRLDLFKKSNDIKFDWGKLEDDLDTWSYEKLDETNRIAKQIKEKLF